MPEYAFQELKQLAEKEKKDVVDFIYEAFDRHDDNKGRFIPDDPLYKMLALEIIVECCEEGMSLSAIQRELAKYMSMKKDKLERRHEAIMRAQMKDPQSKMYRVVNDILTEKENELYQDFEVRYRLEANVELTKREQEVKENEEILNGKQKAYDFEVQRLKERKESFNAEKREFLEKLSPEDRAKYDDMFSKKKEQNKVV